MQNENNKNETLKESKTSPWLDWAVKLQAIAQAGLTYGKDVYDRERYEQIRDIAAEMISLHSGISKEKVVDLFCSEIPDTKVRHARRSISRWKNSSCKRK